LHLKFFKFFVNLNKKNGLNILVDIILINCLIIKIILNNFNKYYNYLFCELK